MSYTNLRSLDKAEVNNRRHANRGVRQNQRQVSGFDRQLDFDGQEVRDVVKRQRQLRLVCRFYARRVSAREP